MPTALIAEDEPDLAQNLAMRLKAMWPQIEIVALCPNGVRAALDIQRLAPDIAFVDIRMPGIDGLEVARNAGNTRVVFVTAYDEYAVAAFEANAIDYLLKPVSDSRLAHCIMRLRRGDPAGSRNIPSVDGATPRAPMNWFTAEDGDNRRLVHVADVLYLQAKEKHTEVVAHDGRYMIRASLKELLGCLDPDLFVQIHRSTIVNVNAVERLETQVFGGMRLHLKGRPDVLTVSRSFVGRFRPI